MSSLRLPLALVSRENESTTTLSTAVYLRTGVYLLSRSLRRYARLLLIAADYLRQRYAAIDAAFAFAY